LKDIAIANSNSHYETDFVVFSACGAENNKIGFIMRIATIRYVSRHNLTPKAKDCTARLLGGAVFGVL
jgi:hypothetical protein